MFFIHTLNVHSDCAPGRPHKRISDIFNSFRFYHIQDIIEIPSKVFFNLFRRTINQLIFCGVFPIFANYSFIHTADENIYIQTVAFLRSVQGCNHEENHSEVRNFNMGTKLKWLAPELRPSRVNFGMWLSRTSCGSIKSVES